MEHATTLSTRLTQRRTQDTLHIALDGPFGQPQADALLEILRGQEAECKRIFIDVRRIAPPQPAAVASFKSSLQSQGLGTGKLFFKGKQGFDLAINGNRVLLLKEKPAREPREKREKGHVCKGNCPHCRCGHHHA